MMVAQVPEHLGLLRQGRTRVYLSDRAFANLETLTRLRRGAAARIIQLSYRRLLAQRLTILQRL